MTPREELIALLDKVYGTVLHQSTWDWDEGVRQWGKCHQGEEWLKTVLALLTDLPMQVRNDPRHFAAWSWGIALLLETWLRQNSKRVLSQIAPLLNNPTTRAVVLDALSGYTIPDAAPYLAPLAAHCAELTEDEALSLVSALGTCGAPEGLVLLERMELPEHMTEAREDQEAILAQVRKGR